MNDRSPGQFYFLHADGDSFFVQCELTLRPELRGKPVIVGGDRGIAVAMTQEAKKLGVHRGMPVFKIKKLYPEVIILEHTFGLYREISMKMHSILSSYLDEVEQYSIDECFAVVKPSDIKYFGSPERLVRAIKKEVQDTLGVTYSFGLARTKALSKVASKLQKPDGMVLLLSEQEEKEALARTPIDDIWGIGWRTAPRFVNMGLSSALDFVQLPDEIVERHFSSSHLVLKRELSGRSIFSVDFDSDPRDKKSIQSTATFRPPSTEPKVIWAELAENVEDACRHARELNLLSNSVSFFAKSQEFRYRFDEVKLPIYTADPGVILDAIEPHFLKLLRPGERIRATGVILSNLRREEDVPRDLFGTQEKAIARQGIELVADTLRRKFGHFAVMRASSIKRVEGKKKS